MDHAINPTDPLANPSEFRDVIELVSREALVYLEGLDTRQMRSPDSDAVADSFAAQLPEEGDGAVAALSELLGRGPGSHGDVGGSAFFSLAHRGGLRRPP